MPILHVENRRGHSPYYYFKQIPTFSSSSSSKIKREYFLCSVQRWEDSAFLPFAFVFRNGDGVPCFRFFGCIASVCAPFSFSFDFPTTSFLRTSHIAALFFLQRLEDRGRCVLYPVLSTMTKDSVQAYRTGTRIKYLPVQSSDGVNFCFLEDVEDAFGIEGPCQFEVEDLAVTYLRDANHQR